MAQRSQGGGDMSCTYFVSYVFSDTKGTGFGNTDVEVEEPIKTMADIRKIEDAITTSHKVKSVRIINFQLL
jgi:hypothetical protein